MTLRFAAVALVFLAACRHAPEPTPPPAPREAPPKVSHKKRPPPPPPREDPAEVEARARRIAAWETGIRAFLEDEVVVLRTCYLSELRRVEEEAVLGAYKDGQAVPPLAGSLSLAIPVEADGAVREPRLDDDTLKNPNVGACLLEQAKHWRFPPPPTGEPVELALPLKFQLMGPGG